MFAQENPENFISKSPGCFPPGSLTDQNTGTLTRPLTALAEQPCQGHPSSSSFAEPGEIRAGGSQGSVAQEGLPKLTTPAGGRGEGGGHKCVSDGSSPRGSLERRGRAAWRISLPEEGKGCRRVAIWLAGRNYQDGMWPGGVHSMAHCLGVSFQL